MPYADPEKQKHARAKYEVKRPKRDRRVEAKKRRGTARRKRIDRQDTHSRRDHPATA